MAHPRAVVALLPALLAALGGCKSPVGIWMVKFEAGESACVDAFDHNFLVGYTPEGEVVDPSWVSTDVTDGSPALAFVQIETTTEGEGLMLFGDEAWPGKGAEDKWTFAWTRQGATTHTDEHRTGYYYQVVEETEEVEELVLSFDGDTAVGELGGQTTALQRWAESDTWNAEVEATVTATGQIPSATYLLTDDPVLGTPVALNNASAIDDCDGEVCQMGLSTVCKGTQRVTATRTDYDSEEAYRQLSAAGQAAGAP